MATYSVNNIKIDNGLFFTPGPTAGYVLSINSSGSTTWITPQSGSSGASGSSGTSGVNGQNGQSSSLFLYKAKANSYTGNPGNSFILWNNATQTGATAIHINHLTQNNLDIDIFLALIRQGSNLTIQHQTNSADYQTWDVNGTPTLVSGADNYWIIPVSLLNSTPGELNEVISNAVNINLKAIKEVTIKKSKVERSNNLDKMIYIHFANMLDNQNLFFEEALAITFAASLACSNVALKELIPTTFDSL